MTTPPPERAKHVQEQTVAVSMKDLITLMASEVARKVVDELRESEIAPLHRKIGQLELQMVKPNREIVETTKSFAHFRGVFDGLWKAAVIAISILELINHIGGHH